LLGQQPKSAQAGRDARAETGDGPLGSEGKRAAGKKKLGFRAESEEQEDFCFLFPFQLFQSIFK
jgi:hypothetical protein